MKTFSLYWGATVLAMMASAALAAPAGTSETSAGSMSELALTNEKLRAEIDKLQAEVRQIRSETEGGLFWLKVGGSVLAVLGAVGGYLFGQNRVTQSRLALERQRDERHFQLEHRREVDAVYQALVQELCSDSPLMRAAAAVKLGKLLESFPSEWSVDAARQAELVDLTKRVLAASLATESDAKVLKTLTIALALHRPWKTEVNSERTKWADLRSVDLSGAKARDAYWARCDLTGADFYAADLVRASLRASVLDSAQFREAKLNDAVLEGAVGAATNFKLADLRGANLMHVVLDGANFEGAKVAGTLLHGARITPACSCQVDVGHEGQPQHWVKVEDWLAGNATSNGP